jgi:signal transduction histidine kinase
MGGRGEVTVSARRDGARVEVRVADRGPGIPAPDLPRVFDPFFTTKPPGQGTGLGLAICHGIVESFGGEIAAESPPGGGAVLRLALRAAEGPDRPGAPA